MNLKAIIAALVLAGTSTAALADPGVRDHRDDTTQLVRDHRDDHKRPSWMVIASSSRLTRGRDVIAANTKLSSLKLVALNGTTTITNITIKFANGTSQKIRLDQTLAPSSQPISIALEGGRRNVTSIVLTGSSNRRAAFEVLGA